MNNVSLTAYIKTSTPLTANVNVSQNLSAQIEKAKSIYEKDYEKLDNLPQINGITLVKNKSFEQLGLRRITNLEIQKMIDDIKKEL